MPQLPRSTLFPYTTLFRSFQNLFFIGIVFFINSIISKLLANRNILLLSTPDFKQKLRNSIQYPFNSFVLDRKSTRLNSSHSQISYAVFCLKKKKRNIE